MDQPVALIGAPKTWAATTTSGSMRQTLPDRMLSDGSIYEQLVVTNLGSVDVFLNFGSNDTFTVAATGEDRGYPLLARTSQSLTVGAATKVATITASGTADVSFQRATGI